MTVATQGGGAAETTTPRPDTLTISVRFSTGTYVARAKGHKQTASCTENAYRAAERLTEKLGMDPKTLELREHLDQRWIFQTIELVPGEFTHFATFAPTADRHTWCQSRRMHRIPTVAAGALCSKADGTSGRSQMRVRNDEIRQLCKLARAMGYAVQQTKRLHLKFTKPGRPPVFCSSTPGDCRAWLNARAQLRRSELMAEGGPA